MEPSTCFLLVGLLVGAAVGALLIEANYRRKAALTKIKGLEVEKKKAKEAIEKAEEKYRQGQRELLTAILLFLLAISLIILIVWVLSTSP